MSALFVHLWTSTIVLGVVLLGVRLMPITARTRYALLAAGLLKLAIPAVAVFAPLRWMGIDLERLGSHSGAVMPMQFLAGPPPCVRWLRFQRAIGRRSRSAFGRRWRRFFSSPGP